MIKKSITTLLAVLAIASMLTVGTAAGETLAEFTARIISEGRVNDVAAGLHDEQPAINLESGRSVTYANLIVIVTTGEGIERMTKLAIHKYSDGTVAAASATTNYVAPATVENSVQRAKRALDAQFGPGNWTFHSIAGTGDARVVRVRVGAVLKAVALGSDGATISVDAE